MYISDRTEELVKRANLVVERGQGELARKWLAAHDAGKVVRPLVPEWLQEILLYVISNDVPSPAVRFLDVKPNAGIQRGQERYFLVVLDLIERKRRTGRYARPRSAKSIDDAAEAFSDALRRLADK